MVVVDGKVVTKPLLEALDEGMVDVPLVVGNMGFEVSRM